MNEFVPGSFERAALDGGVAGVLDLARARCKAVPAGVPERLRKIIAASVGNAEWASEAMTGRIDRLAEAFRARWQDRLLAKMFAQGTLAKVIAPAAMLALMLEHRPRLTGRELARMAVVLHEQLMAHAEWVAAEPPGSVRAELIALAEQAESSQKNRRGRPSKGLTLRATAAFGAAKDRLGIDPARQLPPPAAEVEAVATTAAAGVGADDALALRALAEGAEAGIEQHLGRWALLPNSAYRAFATTRAAMRRSEPRRTDLMSTDPRALSFVARRAADAIPMNRPEAPGLHICQMLAQAHCKLRGVEQPDLSNADGYMRGATADFIESVGEVYGLTLLGTARAGRITRRLKR